MKPKLLFTALAVFAFALVKAQQPQPIPGQYIVVLKEQGGVSPVVKSGKKNNNREQKANDNKAQRDKNLNKVKEVRGKKGIKESAVLSEFADVLVGFTGKLTEAEVNSLKSDPDVDGVFQDYVITLGPARPEANPVDVGYLQTSKDYGVGGAAIDNTANNIIPAQYVTCTNTKAGGSADGSTKSTWIWILDTGIDLDHPDLNVNTSSTFAKSFTGEPVDDQHGHGTHCAGIAAAKNNSIGVIGVSSGARVVPVKVLGNTGNGSWSWLLSGLNHVAMYDIPGDVVSMSLGGYGYPGCENSWIALRDAIKNLGFAGTWVVMAAGNDGADAGLNRPGCINGTRVLTVGSINCSNVCATSSNFNPGVVDWVAVGVSVYSTYKNGTYATLSGTSMATPAVAGILHSKNNYPVSAGTVSCKGATYKIARR